MDALAFESQFLAHTAPVWNALPASVRGRFLVAPELMAHAERLGIAAEPRDPAQLRRLPQRLANPGPGPVALVASIGDIKIGRRLGYRRFVFIEHGAGQAYVGNGSVERNPSYAGGMDREDVDLFLVPNEYSAERWRRAYPLASVVVVGCPKLDTLPRREPGPGLVVAVTFHWDARVCPETQPAREFMGALPALAKRYTVLGHCHPKADWVRVMAPIYQRLGIEYVPEFDDVCRRADVLTFDNTSAGFEFAATGRPVVVMNGATYRRNIHHGLRFWDAATVGVQVDEPRSLGAAVARALENRPEDVAARETALDVVYSDRSPGAAQRAAGAVLEWLGTRVEAAA